MTHKGKKQNPTRIRGNGAARVPHVPTDLEVLVEVYRLLKHTGWTRQANARDNNGDAVHFDAGPNILPRSWSLFGALEEQCGTRPKQIKRLKALLLEQLPGETSLVEYNDRQAFVNPILSLLRNTAELLKLEII